MAFWSGNEVFWRVKWGNAIETAQTQTSRQYRSDTLGIGIPNTHSSAGECPSPSGGLASIDCLSSLSLYPRDNHYLTSLPPSPLWG